MVVHRVSGELLQPVLDVTAVHAHQDLSRRGEHGEVDKEAGQT